MYSTLKLLRLFASMERQAWGSSAPPTEAALEDFFAETHSSIELIMNRESVNSLSLAVIDLPTIYIQRLERLLFLPAPMMRGACDFSSYQEPLRFRVLRPYIWNTGPLDAQQISQSCLSLQDEEGQTAGACNGPSNASPVYCVGSQGNCNSFSPALRFTTLQLMH